jgi:hypothetical protein
VTEIGFPSGPPPYDENSQANFIKSNWSALRSQAYEIFWYEFKDSMGSPTDKESFFGAVTANDAPKPSFWVIKGLSPA